MLVDQKDRCAWSNWPMLDVLKLLEFCLGSCFWQILPLCPLVLGVLFPHPRCWATVIYCPSLLLLTSSEAVPDSHQLSWNCISSFPQGQGPSWERKGDIDCLGAAGHTQQSFWQATKPTCSRFPWPVCFLLDCAEVSVSLSVWK